METKAISKYNAAVTIQSGRVGNVRYYQKGGETYVRSATVSSKNNPRTDAQMKQRLKFASLNHFYSLFGKMLRGAFTNKNKNQSDYNAFMQANQGLGVYFNKKMNSLNATLILPAVISNGKLGNISCTMNESTKGLATTNIECWKPSAETVAGLTVALMSADNFNRFAEGDTLTIFGFLNTTSEGYPVVIMETKQIKLSKTDNTPLNGYFYQKDGYLCITCEGEMQALALVHMNADGKVSTSTIALDSTAISDMEDYQTDAAFQSARDSYGEETSTYLNAKEVVSTDPVITGVSKDVASTASAAIAGETTTEIPVVLTDAGNKYFCITGKNLGDLTAADFTISGGTLTLTKDDSSSSSRLVFKCNDFSNDSTLAYNGTTLATLKSGEL